MMNHIIHTTTTFVTISTTIIMKNMKATMTKEKTKDRNEAKHTSNEPAKIPAEPRVKIYHK